MAKRIIRAVLICVICVCVLSAAVFGVYRYRDKLFPTDEIKKAIGDGMAVICFIDVGQADSTLIMTPDGNMLVDTGTSASEDKLERYLRERGVEELEYLVLTHPHDDHIGGADMILDSFEVEHIVMTDAEDETELLLPLKAQIDALGITVINVSRGDVFSFGELKNSVLAPVRDVEEYGEINDTSIVLRTEIGDSSLLLMGDAQAEVEAELLELSYELLDCDIIKLGHHGSKTSSTYAFLEAVTPEFAIASCGKDNTYAHPAGEVIYKLSKMGVRLFRTDKDGDIELICDGEDFTYIE